MSDLDLKQEYEIIFNHTQDAIFLIEVDENEEFRFLKLNETHERLTGLTNEEVKGKTPFEVLGPKIGQLVDDKYRRCLRQKETISYQEVLDLPAGQKAWLTKLTPVIKQGRVKYIVGSARDVTEEKELNQKLIRLNKRYKLATKGAGIGVWEWNLKTDELTWNQQMYEIYNLNPDKVSGYYDTWVNALDEADRGRAIRKLESAAEKKEDFDSEFKITTSAGKSKYIKAFARFFADAEAEYMIGVNYDITEIKEKRDKIKQQRESFYQVINTAPDCIFIKDEQGRYKLVNKALEELFGLEEKEVIGKTDYQLSATDEESGKFKEDDSLVLNGKQKNIAEEKITDHQGRERWFQTVKVPIQYEGDRSVLGIARDITKRKRAENKLQEYADEMELKNIQLEKASYEAKQASKAKSEFLSAMSHEIRTPMNSIIGMTELLLETDLTGEQKNYIKILQNSGDNLLVLINDILDLSKIESGKIELEESSFDLIEAVEGVLDMMAVKAYQKGLELPFRIDPRVPEYVIGDETRLKQILINLIGNAIKFTETGNILIEVDLAKPPTEDKEFKILFKVKDSGIGIAKEKQEKIFKSFTQADSSSTRKYGGTGLGLAISKNLVQLMDGDIWLESTLGGGSTFYFTANFIKSKAIERTKEVEQCYFDFTKLNILAVDDNKTNLFILEEILIHQGANVDIAKSVDEAIKRLEDDEHNYQLLLLDYLMPNKNGIELAKYIREESALSEIKIMMLSSDFDQRDKRDKLKKYIDLFMMKPIKRKELCKKIGMLMSQEETVAKDQPIIAKVQNDNQSLNKKELKILLAEDVADNRLLIQAYLKATPHQLEMVENGAQAVEKFKEGSYDLILMDIQMPEMDGYQATKEIRAIEAEESLTETPIVALTAYAMEQDRQKAFEIGCNQHLAKPIKKTKLLELIDKTNEQLTDKPMNN